MKKHLLHLRCGEFKLVHGSTLCFRAAKLVASTNIIDNSNTAHPGIIRKRTRSLRSLSLPLCLFSAILVS